MPEQSGALELIPADSIEIKPIEWLWKHWLALGKFHLLAGPAGVGKSRISLSLGSTVTRAGMQWPDGTRNDKAGDFLIWSGEDDYADTLAPVLVALGADMKRVHFLRDIVSGPNRRFFDPSRDCPYLERALKKVDRPRYLHMDPAISVVAKGQNGSANTDIRIAMAPLVDLTARWRLTTVGITHFTKGTAGMPPLERVTGSLAWGAVARVVFAADITDTDERTFARVKTNIGEEGGGFGYSLEVVHVPIAGEVARIRWGAAIEGTPTELLSRATEETASLREIDRWLLDHIQMAGGTVKAQEVTLLGAAEFNCSERSIRRSAKRLKLASQREGFGPGSSSMWSVPHRGQA